MYDLMVIGGGPGGYLAAERAARSGLKTLLFEKNALGGVCLNEGCIPSKTLLNSAKLYQHAADCGVYGVHTEAVRFDQAAVIRRKEQVIRSLVSGVKGKLRRHGVQVIKAQAQILGREKGAFVVSAEGKTYEAARLLIATGSLAVIPPIAGVKDLLGSFVLTNREILELTQVPESLVVIGGGVIGLEMAAYYASVGAKATVGLSREDCLGKGIDFEEKTLSMAYSGRFVAENQDGDGLCKILVDKKRRTILGVHLVGSYAGEMIWGAAQMLELQLRVKDARQIIFPHPTVSEIIRETLWEFQD